MPPVPALLSETCAVTPSSRSCSVSRKPVFIDNAITSVATPAETPSTEKAVTRRNTAGRYGDRRYRLATNHSNRIEGTQGYVTRWVLRKQSLGATRGAARETESRRGSTANP